MTVRVAATGARCRTSTTDHPGNSSGSPSVLAELLTRCGQRDASALAELYGLTSPWIYHLIRRRTASSGQADDAMVVVYAKVWRQAGSFAGIDRSALAWITSIALETVRT